MVESKAWDWKMLDKDDNYWNSAAPEIYYLSKNWKEKEFKSFLDIGVGFGRNAIYMAKEGFNVSGFDLSNYSVEVCKEKFESEHMQYVDLRMADMHQIPYVDYSFDCILALNVVSHTDTIGFKNILSEIFRVLKKDGEVYFTLGSKESFWFNNEVCTYVDENTRIRVEDGPENGIPHFYVNDEDVKKMFNEYKIIDIRNIKELTQKGNFSPHYQILLKK